MKRKRAYLVVLTGGLALWLAQPSLQSAPEKTIKLPEDSAMANLKPGPGVEVVRNECGICHSTDYIVRQPGGDAKHWEPEVTKMIKVYGAPISEADAKTIVSYLATAYGAEAAEGRQKAEGSKPK